ncbi:MAG: hypothetical protein KGN76_00835 [Acidobacteriota bacterium]|nr:hypothetical protein [Acidobacteriota bacterium]
MTRILRLLVAALLLSAPAAAQTLAVKPQSDPVPAGLAPALQPLLAPGGQRVTVGITTLTFWWVKSLPLAGDTTGAPDWSQVPEGSLVGVMQTSDSFADIRGHSFKAGLYTLRYGVQPADGNHLGVSPYRDFLLVGPAAADTTAAPLGHDGVIALSTKASGLAHPAVLSLDPPTTTQPVGSVITAEPDMALKSAIFEVPVSRAGANAGTLRFGLVLEGIIQQ